MKKTIEPDGSHFTVWTHGIYGNSSVLEGQYKRSFQGSYDSLVEAQRDHPDGELIDHSTRRSSLGCESLADLSGLPLSPPAWFDPANAGESWDEDCY